MTIRYYDWISHHARTSPDQLALHDLTDGEALTYQNLECRVAQLAGWLQQHVGVRRHDRVASLAQNRSELFELVFACARLGAIYVPLNWRLTQTELQHLVDDCSPKALVFDDQSAPLAQGLRTPSTLVQLDSHKGFAPMIGAIEPVGQADAAICLDDVQMIMYTSGTTGRPKGALLTYGMTFWNATNVGIPALIGPESRFLSMMPMFHTAGLNLFANPVLHAGGTVLIMRSFDPVQMLSALTDPELAITHTFAVPAAYQFVAQLPDFADARFPSLKVACVGGAATPATVLNAWIGKGVAVPNGYGMTESGPGVALLLPRDAARKQGSVGRPLLHTEVRVVADGGREAAPEEPGELLVRGPNVTPGYWNNPAATADAFAEGWLKTGDIVSRDAEGFIYVLDRAKDMYISGGENVYPAEVESVLSALPQVAEAAVVGIPDERWGEVGLAVLTIKAGAVLVQDQVLAHCEQHLARFKHPRRIEFVEALPRTASGKIHKPTLREQFCR